MTNRRLKNFGLHPLLAYLLLFLAFAGITLLIFTRMPDFASYLYVLLALLISTRLNDKRRNDFLKICFTVGDYKKIRIIENLLVALPFIIFLSFKLFIFEALILIVSTTLLALVSFNTTYSFIIPTPFYKKPFEFTTGFRNTFYLIALAYILIIITVVVHNFNLGIFSLLLIFASTLSYYTRPENEYYVWSFNLTPFQFLYEKIRTALFFSLLLCLPVLLLLIVFYPQDFKYTFIFFLLGYFYLTAIILAKYSAYPNEINLVQVILLAISLYFPPMLILLIPYFYIGASNKLKNILE